MLSRWSGASRKLLSKGWSRRGCCEHFFKRSREGPFIHRCTGSADVHDRARLVINKIEQVRTKATYLSRVCVFMCVCARMCMCVSMSGVCACVCVQVCACGCVSVCMCVTINALEHKFN